MKKHRFDKPHVLREPTKKPLSFSGFGHERAGSRQIQMRSTALFGALAGVLFVAGRHTTLQTHTLTAAMGAQGHARQCGQRCSEFTVCFGNDFVAHLWLQINNAKRY